jgi:hypothetical protein
MIKSRVSSILAKAAALRINLNLDGAPITSPSHNVRRVPLGQGGKKKKNSTCSRGVWPRRRRPRRSSARSTWATR